MNEHDLRPSSPISEEHIAQRRAVDGVRRARKEKRRPKTALTESLDALTEADFTKKSGRRGSSRGFTVTQWVLFGLCFAVFAFAAWQVLVNFFDYAEAKRQYDDLKEIFYSSATGEDYLPEPAPAPATATLEDAMQTGETEVDENVTSGFGGEVNYPVILARLTKLKSLNADTYGWITVSGTDVDYPVVQGDDNSFYLRRSFYKTALNSGSIFVDAACDVPAKNRNTVLYGHNMKDGTMFHSLHNLANQAYFEQAEIRLMTTEGIYVYDVYSVHKPHELEPFFYTQFTDAKWVEFLNWTKEQSIFPNSDVSLSPGDRVITLSTCISTTTQDPYRFVVHGVLREVIGA